MKMPEADFLVTNHSTMYMFWRTVKTAFYQNARGGFFRVKSLYNIYVLAHYKTAFYENARGGFFHVKRHVYLYEDFHLL